MKISLSPRSARLHRESYCILRVERMLLLPKIKTKLEAMALLGNAKRIL